MNEEIIAYQQYLLNFGLVEKPLMPNFDVEAYTESEYLSIVFDWLKLFDGVDACDLTLKHLKGD